MYTTLVYGLLVLSSLVTASKLEVQGGKQGKTAASSSNCTENGQFMANGEDMCTYIRCGYGTSPTYDDSGLINIVPSVQYCPYGTSIDFNKDFSCDEQRRFEHGCPAPCSNVNRNDCRAPTIERRKKESKKQRRRKGKARRRGKGRQGYRTQPRRKYRKNKLNKPMGRQNGKERRRMTSRDSMTSPRAARQTRTRQKEHHAPLALRQTGEKRGEGRARRFPRMSGDAPHAYVPRAYPPLTHGFILIRGRSPV